MENFDLLLAENLLSRINNIGFKKITNLLFVRFQKTHEIHVISIQKHSSDLSVCVNFGVHYDFLPKLGSTDLPTNGEIELAECEIRVRLTPESFMKDYWWTIELKTIDEITKLVEKHLSTFFNSYDIDGYIFSITPRNLNESPPPLIAMLTKVRACLILARIHEVSCDTTNAKDFALLGIKHAGMAVGPKKMLKEVLKRVKSD